jgi:hypothetical protein
MVPGSCTADAGYYSQLEPKIFNETWTMGNSILKPHLTELTITLRKDRGSEQIR